MDCSRVLALHPCAVASPPRRRGRTRRSRRGERNTAAAQGPRQTHKRTHTVEILHRGFGAASTDTSHRISHRGSLWFAWEWIHGYGLRLRSSLFHSSLYSIVRDEHDANTPIKTKNETYPRPSRSRDTWYNRGSLQSIFNLIVKVKKNRQIFFADFFWRIYMFLVRFLRSDGSDDLCCLTARALGTESVNWIGIPTLPTIDVFIYIRVEYTRPAGFREAPEFCRWIVRKPKLRWYYRFYHLLLKGTWNIAVAIKNYNELFFNGVKFFFFLREKYIPTERGRNLGSNPNFHFSQ